MNTALNRTMVIYLLNHSGISRVRGDVVIVDGSLASAYTSTTTPAYVDGLVGVVLEDTADNTLGKVAIGGYVPKVNLSASAVLGDLLATHSVAGQAAPHAAPFTTGDFGMVLGTGTTPSAIIFMPPTPSVGGGEVAEVLAAAGGHLTIMPYSYDAANGTWTIFLSGSSLLFGYLFNSSAADGDWVEYKVFLTAGTYSFMCIHPISTDGALLDVSIDGDVIGTIEFYSGGLVWNVRDVLTDIVVETSGLKTLKMLVNGKNPSSSAYMVYPSLFSIWQTA